MKIKYFASTDTLYIELRTTGITETHDLDENTILDSDTDGQVCAITLEHASQRADIPQFSYEMIPA
ncbi:MAG: DUF2283 domain-containing protein [Pseudomonadota bacterium]